MRIYNVIKKCNSSFQINIRTGLTKFQANKEKDKLNNENKESDIIYIVEEEYS